jgi:arachidonate 15-lipoxygenase
VVLATHRQLAETHPIFKLLYPHMRFTLSINDGAMHNLVIPGGVVATNVGTAMASTLDLVNAARQAFQWDQHHPERIFAARGVASESLVFPFRDDTLLVWKAIKSFVRRYLGYYYEDAGSITGDGELQAWVNELVSPQCGDFHGMNGLIWDTRKKTFTIESLDYLTDLVAQIVYTAAPKHAAVNYPQYPLGSYAPSVAASIYAPPPTFSQTLTKAEHCLPWYLPLDVALYAISFEYLLSGVQYDRLGHYDSDPGAPYFDDPAVRDIVALFQADLAQIETVIRARNQLRPMPYPFQLPSQIPNSISI